MKKLLIGTAIIILLIITGCSSDIWLSFLPERLINVQYANGISADIADVFSVKDESFRTGVYFESKIYLVGEKGVYVVDEDTLALDKQFTYNYTGDDIWNYLADFAVYGADCDYFKESSGNEFLYNFASDTRITLNSSNESAEVIRNSSSDAETFYFAYSGHDYTITSNRFTSSGVFKVSYASSLQISQCTIPDSFRLYSVKYKGENIILLFGSEEPTVINSTGSHLYNVQLQMVEVPITEILDPANTAYPYGGSEIVKNSYNNQELNGSVKIDYGNSMILLQGVMDSVGNDVFIYDMQGNLVKAFRVSDNGGQYRFFMSDNYLYLINNILVKYKME